ncbi:50S ribosomal protein L1 [Candidatus Woesearchaeota archaeon]|nr:50S ribosomal protein L1 [Candidatus Woesearchaeota archaeon]
MEKKSIAETLEKLRQLKKRNFSQSYELIVNIKDLDLKKNENQVDFFARLPNGTGRPIKVCAFVDQIMLPDAKETCEEVILQEDFQKFGKEKKLAKNLARKYDFFIAQANMMAQVATFFGRALGPKGKMPNPKSGCIVMPKANLKTLRENLEKTIRVSARTAPVIQCIVGTENMDTEKVAENVINMYEQIIHHLPNEEANVKNAFLKLTMSPPLKIK